MTLCVYKPYECHANEADYVDKTRRVAIYPY